MAERGAKVERQVEFVAPPDTAWKSVTALAVVNVNSGVVNGVALWNIPAGAPTKP
ncbi:MAG TPA: hypothetical protein VIO34_06295 [Candidatus Dormibacteraeota bacterium]